MAGYWLKLYTEILNDPKYCRLSDAGKLGMLELMVVAKIVDQDGRLPGVEDVAFYTRRDVEWWKDISPELISIKYLAMDDEGMYIRKFKDRQAPIPGPERAKRSRELRNRNQYRSDYAHDTHENACETHEDAHERDGEQNRIDKTRTDTDKKQTTPVVVASKKPKEKISVKKAKAASMLTARMVSNDTLKEFLPVYKPDMIIDYCHAYDQAIKDGIADNTGWLVKALRQGWDIKKLLKKREQDLLQDDPSRYVTGKYAEVVEH